jgi:hypothetical protein
MIRRARKSPLTTAILLLASLLPSRGLAIQTVALAWDPSPNPDVIGYRLYQRLNSEQYTIPIELPGLMTNRTIRVEPGTNFFVVTAYNSFSESLPSNEISYFLPAENWFDSFPDRTTEEDTPISIPVTIRYQGSNPLKLALTGRSDDEGILANSNFRIDGYGTNWTVTLIPNTNQYGSTRISLDANDGGASASTSFQLHVEPVNDPPRVDPVGDLVLVSGENPGPVFLTGISAGAGNEPDTLTLTALSSNPGLLPDPMIQYSGQFGAASMPLRLQPGETGEAFVTVQVNDGQGSNNLAWRSFLVAVRSPTNSAPTISPLPLPEQILDEDHATGLIAFTVNDASTPPGQLAVRASSSNPTLVPDENIYLGGNGINRTVRVVPLPDQSGGVVITIVVSDGKGGVGRASFAVIVNPVNDLPALGGLPTVQINEDTSTGALPLTIEDRETEPASLALTAYSTNPGLTPVLTNFLGAGRFRALRIDPAPNQFGTAVVSVVVRDTDGGAATNSFLLRVNPVNDPPTLDPIDELIVFGNETTNQIVRLSGITSGATNEQQPLLVTAVSSNPSLITNPVVTYRSPDPSGSLTFAPRTNQNGEATITVTVNDGSASNNIVNRSFKVTVIRVSPPVISPVPNQTVDEDGAIGPIPVTIWDKETPAGRLNLQGYSLNPLLVPYENIHFAGSGSNRTITLVPAPDAFGTTVVSLVTWDEDFDYATRDFVLTVNPVNDAPALDAIDSVTIYTNDGPRMIGLTGIGAGGADENQQLTISREWSNPNVITDVAVQYTSPEPNARLVISPSAQGVGSATVTVKVKDDGGTLRGGQDTSLRSFVVTVLPIPALQIKAAGANLMLSWPAAARDFELEVTPNLFSPVWRSAAVRPATMGDRSVVIWRRSAGHEFFRLRRVSSDPRLNIRLAQGRVLVSWPAMAVGYELESAESFSAGSWEKVQVSPVLSGEQNRVTLQLSNVKRFFRLRKP